MGRNINNNKLSKQYILSNISQVTIFSTYLNLSDKIVQNCIDTGELICSPIRDDVHPTCGFRYDNRGKLKFRDFSGFFWGDAFDLVAFVMSNMYNKQYNVNDKEDFVKILRHITFTFKDIFYGQERDINMINSINVSIEDIKHKKQIIEVVVRNWNKDDERYWNQFGVPLQLLNVNFIYPVEQYYINRNINPTPKYFYDTNDVCYAYNLGQDRHGVTNIKLYFPNRDKGTTRFITNCNHLEGIYNLDSARYDIIIITKSTKDRLSLMANINHVLSLYGGGEIVRVGYINLPHETYRLRQNEYDWISSKLNYCGMIISLMDNDRTGMREAIWLQSNYNIVPVLIPKEFKSKDFADFVKQHKREFVYVQIRKAIKWFSDRLKEIRDKRESSEFGRNKRRSETDALPY